MENKISLPCSLEPQMGNCVWGYVHKYEAYMCSICGEEFLKLMNRTQIICGEVEEE
jgi:hypothetical protein